MSRARLRRVRPASERGVPIAKAITSLAEVEKAPLSTAQINRLPDAAFALVLPGGKKDDEGKTVPRSLRVLPHHTGSARSGSEHTTLDLPRLRNALARLSQTDLTDSQMAEARAHLNRHADEVLPSRGGKPAKKAITSPDLDDGGRLNPAQVGGPGILDDEPRAKLPPAEDFSGLPARGVTLPSAMAKAVMDGSKTLLVKAVNLPIGGQRLLLLSGRSPVGIVTLGKAQKISEKQLAGLEPQHLLTRAVLAERAGTAKGWDRGPFYAYPILKAERVSRDDRARVKPKAKAQEQAAEPVSKIKDVDAYDPRKVGDAVLRDDFRILLAWHAAQKADPEGFEHSAATIEGMMAKLLREAARRGPKAVRFNPRGMRPDSREFFLRIARRVKLPREMLKRLALDKDTDPGDLTDAELAEAHGLLHRMLRAEAFTQDAVKGWSVEDITNMHARVVDEMEDRGARHPKPPSDDLDETSEEFEIDTAKARYAAVHHSGNEQGKEIRLKDVLPHFKTFKLRRPYVYLVGGLANHGKTRGDIDVLVKDSADLPDAFRDALEFRLGRALPPGLSERLQIHYDKFHGPFTSHVELFDLVVERVEGDQVVEMRAPDGDRPGNVLTSLGELRTFLRGGRAGSGGGP